MEIKLINKMIGLIIGTTGIVIGFWDMVVSTYFIVTGMWIYLVFGDLK